MKMKEYYVDRFLSFKNDDNKELDDLVKNLEAYVSESGSDAQLELILYAFKVFKEEYHASSFGDCCKAAAPIFELLKTVDWGWVELQALACVIGYTPNYKIAVELKQKAFDVLGKNFANHKSFKSTKMRYNFSLSLRLLRARYYENPNPEEIEAEFDQCVNEAISVYEKWGFEALKRVLLVRKALFYGNSDDVVTHIYALQKTKDKVWLATTKDEVVEYFQALGDNLNTDLKNLAIGHQIRKRRREIRLKVRDVATAIGTATSVVYEFESGSRGISNTRLCSVAQILKTDMAYFFGGSNKQVPDAVTDATIHKVVQLMSNMSEKQKEYIIGIVRDFAQFNVSK